MITYTYGADLHISPFYTVSGNYRSVYMIMKLHAFPENRIYRVLHKNWKNGFLKSKWAI